MTQHIWWGKWFGSWKCLRKQTQRYQEISA